MKVELTIKAGWNETIVKIEGATIEVERVVEAIKSAFRSDLYTEIK